MRPRTGVVAGPAGAAGPSARPGAAALDAVAAALGVSLDYVYAMRQAGAPFWGRVTTVSAMMEWWRLNPSFRYKHTRIGSQRCSLPARRETSANCGIRIL